MDDRQAAPGKGAAPTMQELLEIMLCPPNTLSGGIHQAHTASITVLDILTDPTITLRVSRVSGRVERCAALPEKVRLRVDAGEERDDRTGIYAALDRASGRAIAVLEKMLGDPLCVEDHRGCCRPNEAVNFYHEVVKALNFDVGQLTISTNNSSHLRGIGGMLIAPAVVASKVGQKAVATLHRLGVPWGVQPAKADTPEERAQFLLTRWCSHKHYFTPGSRVA